MSNYTKDEIDELLKTLLFCTVEVEAQYGSLGYIKHSIAISYQMAIRAIDKSNNYAVIIIDHSTTEILVSVLVDILNDPTKVNEYRGEEYNKIHEGYRKLDMVINQEHINKMPLHLKSFPEIASWRLKINK